MTTYTGMPNTDIDQDSPGTQPLFTALRDNPIAISEGESGSPVLRTGWHPYDMVNVGDGADGVFYDHAVDGDVSTIVSPSFEDGFEYLVIVNGMRANFGSGTVLITYSGHRLTDGIYSTIGTHVAATSVYTYYGEFLFRLPMVQNISHIIDHRVVDSVAGVLIAHTTANIVDVTIQKVNKFRITIDSGVSFDAGTVALYRRREFITG